MKIIDISQELFTCAVYPGDTVPVRTAAAGIEAGDSCNLTDLTLCAHNGTHVDAPYHFIRDGKTIDRLDLYAVIGKCCVVERTGDLSAEAVGALLTQVRQTEPEAAKRILFKGDAVITETAAEVFAADGVLLIGTESQSVGPMEAPEAVHRILLGAEVVLLEGIRLAEAAEGVYWLNAAPINLGGCDGAPCRAVLICD